METTSLNFLFFINARAVIIEGYEAALFKNNKYKDGCMKIYKHIPVQYVRLTFKRKGDGLEYLPLIETTIEETEAMVKSALNDLKINPFEKYNTTTIEIREAKGGKNGKFKAISFKGLSPLETKERITNYITSLNNTPDRRGQGHDPVTNDTH